MVLENSDLFYQYFFKSSLYSVLFNRQAINHCIVCRVGYVTLKKELLFTNTELHRYKIN